MNTKPRITSVKKILFEKPEFSTLDNGVEMWIHRSNELPVIKIEWTFMAGRPAEHKKLADSFTCKLLSEGTKSRSGNDIAELFDKAGATFQVDSGVDYATITLYCLVDKAIELIKLIDEIINEPLLSADDLERIKDNSAQKLSIDLTRGEIVSYRDITENLFGPNSPYGYNTTTQLIEEINQEDTVRHHRLLLDSKLRIFISGCISSEIEKELAIRFGKTSSFHGIDISYRPQIYKGERVSILHIDDKTQSSLRLARKSLLRRDAGFIDLYMLNLIFGAYFGSRLSMDLREKQGLTYHIGSYLEPMVFDSCLIISCELSAVNLTESLRAITIHMKMMKEQLVSKQEFEQMKRHLMGNLMQSVDGPFRKANLTKLLVNEAVAPEALDFTVDRINSINRDEILRIASDWLNIEDFIITIAGNIESSESLKAEINAVI